MPVTRFAPSPSGWLHAGHARAAWEAHSAAAGGRFLIRMEDIDSTRCRPEYEAAILEDLSWLGLEWSPPVWRQSERMAVYAEALGRLQALGVLYPCFCTRHDIASAGQAPQGPEGPLYPGTCRRLTSGEISEFTAAGRVFALRLDTGKASAMAGPLSWLDLTSGLQRADPLALGDVVLARKETPCSYHLAVTIDDAAQEISIVTRGVDLFPATHVHRLLQALLDLPVPVWNHHQLVCDTAGRRLAKRDDARSLRSLRAEGLSPGDVRRLCGMAG